MKTKHTASQIREHLQNNQSIFYVQLLFSGLVCLWFWKRQRETLKPENRIPMTRRLFINGLKEVLREKSTMGYTAISGFVFGSFMVYLSGSQQIFEIQYGLKEDFPLIFAGLSIAIGTAIFTNGSLVLKFGMRKMVHTAMAGFFIVSTLYVVLFYGQENPSIGILMAFFAAQFFAIGFLFGNLRALAMEPMGHIAGMASAITGFFATIMAIPISTFIGRFIETKVWPVFFGFMICSFISLFLLQFSKKAARKKAALNT